MSSMPSNLPSTRPLSPFNLFQRFKRSVIVAAREKNAGADDLSVETLRRLVSAAPGLEEYSSAAIAALPPDDLADLRRIKIRSALCRYDASSSAKGASAAFEKAGWGFFEANRVLSAGWKGIDDLGASVFEELAEEMRNANNSTPPAVSRVLPFNLKPITPQLHHGDDVSPAGARAAADALPLPSVCLKDPVSDDDGGSYNLVQRVTFPRQLMDVVEHQSNGGAVTASGERVLEWLPGGDAFIIRDKNVLEREVLPKHFSAKCKFMSFVRKLYRWGFRQLEKDSRGILIFSHSNFLRGDKNRCLKMRSVVKKASLKGQQGTVFDAITDVGGGVPGHSPASDLRAFGDFSSPADPRYRKYYGMGGSSAAAMGGCYAPVVPPPASLGLNRYSPAQPRLTRPYLDRRDSYSPDGPGLGGGPPSPSSLAYRRPVMTSAEMFDAALRLERMEKREEMRNLEMMDLLHGGGGGGGAYDALPSLAPRPVMGSGEGYGVNPVLGNMSDVELAYEMMKQDSRMEALKTLEFVNRV